MIGAVRIAPPVSAEGLLEPPDWYGLCGQGGWPLPPGTRHGDPVPHIADEGFLWCGLGAVDATTLTEKLQIAGMPHLTGRAQVPGAYRLARSSLWSPRSPPALPLPTLTGTVTSLLGICCGSDDPVSVGR
jgi:hypothetical protein